MTNLDAMTHYFFLGAVLGLSAGFSPGPLLALVISETLRHDIKAGMRVALSPLITDLPIVLLTLFALAQLAAFKGILGTISLVGGIVILYMGYESLNPKPVMVGVADARPNSLLKGVLANVLSPHPYLFWISVGGPIMSKALNVGVETLIIFIGGFYVSLVGAKIVTALLVGWSRTFLNGRVYVWIMRILGCALCLLALLLFRDGLALLGVSIF